MGVLLILVGMLGIASGGLKLRGRVQETFGRSPVAIGEAAAGAVAIVVSAAGLSSVRPLAWTVVVLALGLTLVSTWTYARRVARYVSRREASEALRLKAYLRSREQSR
jgi:sensor histidine kinase regulating citrate/malate metabolism